MSEVAAPVGFFGKLPARGDFVRANGNQQLMVLLDRWAGSALEMLSRNSDWKRLYDQAPPMAFAFVGSRNRLAIAGHFLPSADASQRRFPFLSATGVEVAQPLEFIARCPLAFSRLWTTLSRLSADVVRAEEPTAALRVLGESSLRVNTAPAAYDAALMDFLDLQSIGSLQELLEASGHRDLQLKWVLPALGLLLQPALTGASAHLEKALALPLPRDPLYRTLVATFWMDLIAGFIGRAPYELAILIQDVATPRLVVGFAGADAASLYGVLDPVAAREQLILVDDAEWVEEQLASDYALNKLVGYLERDEFSLRSARQFFRETFLGA